MYIKYKSLSNQSIQIVNVNVQNCKTITTDNNKLMINMPEDSKDKTAIFTLLSTEDAIKSLDKLFDILHMKSPIGNLLDLTNLDEEIIIEETDTEPIVEEE